MSNDNPDVFPVITNFFLLISVTCYIVLQLSYFIINCTICYFMSNTFFFWQFISSDCLLSSLFFISFFSKNLFAKNHKFNLLFSLILVGISGFVCYACFITFKSADKQWTLRGESALFHQLAGESILWV